MKKIQKRTGIVNMFGAVGYMLLVAVWGLFAAIIFVLLLEPATTGQITESAPAPSVSGGQSSGAVVVAGYVITAVAIMVTVGVLLTLPYFIGKWGSKLLRGMFRSVKLRVTSHSLFLAKGIIIVLPLLGLTVIQYMFAYEDVTFGAIFVASVAAATLGLAAFTAQQLLAKRLGVAIQKTW